MISFADQIELLKKRGMTFADEARAARLFRNISYYRLSGYWYPLLSDKPNHLFKAGADFETAFTIYRFDSKLRKLIMSELEKIEIAVRTQMAYSLSAKHGGYWFTNAANFIHPANHHKLMAKIAKEYTRSDEEFITAFKKKYSDPFPPAWMTMEITSFGTLSFLYSNLKPGKDKREVAAYFGLPDTVFSSWLHSIVYIRNICAHHCRLWNRTLSIRPLMPRNARKPFIGVPPYGTQQIYFVLSMILYLLNTVNPNHTFKERLNALLVNHPNIDTEAMGFPAGWKKETIWQ